MEFVCALSPPASTDYPVSVKTFIFWSILKLVYLRLYKRNNLTLGQAVARTAHNKEP